MEDLSDDEPATPPPIMARNPSGRNVSASRPTSSTNRNVSSTSRNVSSVAEDTSSTRSGRMQLTTEDLLVQLLAAASIGNHTCRNCCEGHGNHSRGGEREINHSREGEEREHMRRSGA